MLTLKRPLVFLDLETTGTDTATAKIVSFSFVKIQENEGKRIYSSLVNPGIKIPSEATDVHGITDEMVKDAPRFYAIRSLITDFIEGCDLAGYNLLRFDIPVLFEEFAREQYDWDTDAYNIIDVMNIFVKKEPRTLAGAFKFYLKEELTNAHDADADTFATLKVFFAQLEKYEDLPLDVAELAKFTRGNAVDLAGKFTIDEKGEYYFNFGKNIGQKCSTDLSYIKWMLTGSFNNNTKKVARKILHELSRGNNIRL